MLANEVAGVDGDPVLCHVQVCKPEKWPGGLKMQ